MFIGEKNIPTVHPGQLMLHAGWLHELVAERSIGKHITRTEAICELLSELGVDLGTFELADGWVLAADVGELPSEAAVDYEALYDHAEHEAKKLSCRYDSHMWCAVEDVALPQLVSEDVDFAIDWPQVLAATEELAMMGLLAVSLDPEARVFFEANELGLYCPGVVEANSEDMRDFWRAMFEPRVRNAHRERLSEIDSGRLMDWHEEGWARWACLNR